MRIYLAGPLFTAAERAFNAQLRDGLTRRKFAVWLPQEHESSGKTAEQIFADDVAAIDAADVVVANMDGADPDSGTCWECGYAYAKGKPRILFRTDFRLAEKEGRGLFNPMLAASASLPPLDLTCADMEEIAEKIASELGNLPQAKSHRG